MRHDRSTEMRVQSCFRAHDPMSFQVGAESNSTQCPNSAVHLWLMCVGKSTRPIRFPGSNLTGSQKRSTILDPQAHFQEQGRDADGPLGSARCSPVWPNAQELNSSCLRWTRHVCRSTSTAPMATDSFLKTARRMVLRRRRAPERSKTTALLESEKGVNRDGIYSLKAREDTHGARNLRGRRQWCPRHWPSR